MKPATKIELLFGKIAVSCGFVSPEQIDEAVVIQERDRLHQHLGRILVMHNFMTEEELMTVLAIQRENRSRVEMSPAVRRLGMTLGSLAIERGYCTEDEVHACIREQAKLERFNLFFRLGEVMVSRNVLSVDQVHELLQSQNITILGCPGCFSKFNVLNYKPAMEIACPKCGGQLQVPDSLESIKVDATLNEPGDPGQPTQVKGDEDTRQRRRKASGEHKTSKLLKDAGPDYVPPKQADKKPEKKTEKKK